MDLGGNEARSTLPTLADPTAVPASVPKPKYEMFHDVPGTVRCVCVLVRTLTGTGHQNETLTPARPTKPRRYGLHDMFTICSFDISRFTCFIATTRQKERQKFIKFCFDEGKNQNSAAIVAPPTVCSDWGGEAGLVELPAEGSGRLRTWMGRQDRTRTMRIDAS
jgi:hypothetical protein